MRFKRIFRGGTMELFTNEFGLARNFGFDITMPDGSMGLPGVAHRDYMDKCQGLYREFISNMNTHIKYEKEVKKVLKGIHREKIQNMRFSLYRAENDGNDNDPFARRPNSTVSLAGLTTRTNTPWGLDVIHDEDENTQMRPHTAPSPGHRSVDDNAFSSRPKTAGVLLNRENEDDNATDVTAVTNKTILGVVDPKTEGTVSQKITVGQHSFTKLDHGQLRARLKNKEGQFIIKPIKKEYKSEDGDDIVAFDPSKIKKTYDPLNEKLALVKKITNFRTPTISSDMKINNRIPIQKTLRGLDAKRTTVVDIYRNARDRRTRHFRIVSAKTRYGTAGAPGDEDNDVLNSTETIKRSKTLSDFGTKIGVFARLSRLRAHVSRSPTIDDHHLSVSQNGNKLKSILHTQHDSIDNGRESQMDINRPSSKVAFARNDSDMYDHNRLSLVTPDMARNPSDSFNSNYSKKDSSSTSGNQQKRQRTVTENSEGDDNVFRARQSSDMSMASVVVDVMRQRLGIKTEVINNQGGEPEPDMLKLPPAEGRSPSVASVVSASSFINKLKKATQTTKDSENSQLGFDLPSKMESNFDTVKIIKQQMKKDKNLDERMAVWRRRMALKTSNSSTSLKKRNSNKPRF